jgi:Icc-related predicted phosphoesterase
VGFAGTKGFCGGFDRHALAPWGESTIKEFVRETIDEALKLESGLGRLRTPHRIGVLHYAPVRATVEGEPPEIFAFLGSSRLAEPLDRFEVDACVHGHAHNGSFEGRTAKGIPVFNVAMSIMRARDAEHPYHVIELTG